MIAELLQLPLSGPLDELAHRWKRAEARIRENGVSYNVYTDPRGASRPWEIDAIPLLISSDEWQRIEAGIIQRAHVLNMLLADLYGPRRLISSGDLPAALLFANPGFLRPLAGLQIPQRNYLHLLAVDLARSPDGQWWVIADRTEAPSGAGYALENRTIISEVFPDQFRESRVLRLASFFRGLREALMGLSVADTPRVVLLTPGPFNETYFEHAYLARYLGFPLVEGADLTVRDRHVYLKTVEGLQQVDVILRRVDGSFADPLELRGDSFLGIAGLVDAITEGNVSVANALGSGVIESAAIMPFLPFLARKLLGEPLKLPSVATWWCGQEYALNWVRDHLNQVVIKPAFPSRAMEPVFGATLASSEKHKLVDRLNSRPYDYVAQEQVALSTAPVWDHGHLYSRSLVLRTYVLNTGNGWIAMPGGLVRVSGANGPVVSMQQGGLSKDAWVVSDGPVDTFSLLRPKDQVVELRRGPGDLTSRAADNLFWLGRYAERAESITRLLRCIALHLRQATTPELACLIRLYGCLGPDSNQENAAPDLETEVTSLLTDAARVDSLCATLSEIQRIGGSVRDRLSMDMTRLIGQLAGSARVERGTTFVEYPTLLTGCLELLSAFSGMHRENVTRGPGWLFLSLGRRLERAVFIIRQLRELTTSFDAESYPLLEYLLEVEDSTMTYRSRYYTTLQRAAVLDVLMADESNPRSLVFQLEHLVDFYGRLPRHASADLRTLKAAWEMVRGVNLRDPDQSYGKLHGALTGLGNMLPSWCDNFINTYFSHARRFAIRVGE
jgi:uncharacterized circularly permuted ATP-grasp superfamily protein/uncharacterized alpha-E superfamily protein